MREILFRGKRMDNGEWVSSGNIIRFNPENDENLVFIPALNELCRCVHDENDNIEAFEKGMFYKVDSNTVGQFTGLTDKNGKKIFEGDILQACLDPESCVGKVIFDERIAAFEILYNNGLCNIFEDFFVARLKVGERVWYEVIGNIHDNPELLEG